MKELHVGSRLLQRTRCNIAVPAIIAGSAEDDITERSGKMLKCRGGDSLSCLFHEPIGINARGGSGAIDCGHIVRREEQVCKRQRHGSIIDAKSASKTTAIPTPNLIDKYAFAQQLAYNIQAFAGAQT
jgi:hypothetical protein